MMRRIAASFLVAASVALAACGSPTPNAPSSGRASPLAAVTATTVTKITDPPPIALKPPVPVNDAQRLSIASLAIYNFCAGWPNFVVIDEAPAHDVDKQVRFATDAYAALEQIDVTAKIKDRHALQPRDISLPTDVVHALQVELNAAYAYKIRVTIAQANVAQRLASTAVVNAYLDYAFQQQATSRDLAIADQLLHQYHAEHC